jgi:hypothetical protein
LLTPVTRILAIPRADPPTNAPPIIAHAVVERMRPPTAPTISAPTRAAAMAATRSSVEIPTMAKPSAAPVKLLTTIVRRATDRGRIGWSLLQTKQAFLYGGIALKSHAAVPPSIVSAFGLRDEQGLAFPMICPAMAPSTASVSLTARRNLGPWLVAPGR